MATLRCPQSEHPQNGTNLGPLETLPPPDALCPTKDKVQHNLSSVLIPKVWDFQSGILIPQVELNHPRQGMLGQALSISCSQPVLQH